MSRVPCKRQPGAADEPVLLRAKSGSAFQVGRWEKRRSLRLLELRDTARAMSSGHAVRKPLSVRARRRRTLEERLAVRFPRLFGLLTRATTRLPPESRIRQAMIRRAVEQGFSATNRRDFDAVLPRYDADVEIAPMPELVALGIAPSYLGHDGYVSLWNDWDSAWADHAQWEPRELIDLGDRLLTLGKMRGTGEASGIAVDTEIALLMTLKNGKVIREEHYAEPAQALEAAKLERRAASTGP